MKIDLSICIPTYNKAEFIFSTLESIEKQNLDFNVEVVILDGASTDNTKEIVNTFKNKIKNLHYHLEISNNGIDFDLDKTVTLANGNYCWLMSSDDLMVNDSVNYILSNLNKNLDILICEIFYADKSMKIWGKSKFFKNKNSTIYDISKINNFINYLNNSNSNNALFCYMSNIIFLRENWINNKTNIIANKTCYGHVYKLLSFHLNEKCNILYIDKPLIINRPDSDSFSHNGIEKRYLIDFEGYLLIANKLFKSNLFFHNLFLANMKKEHNFFRIAKLRSNISNKKNWEHIKYLLFKFGYSNIFIIMVNFIGKFKFLISTLELLNSKLKKIKTFFYNNFNTI